MDFFFKKLEANKGGSEVAIYIDNLSEKTFCFDINAIRVAIVQDLKSGTIEAFDYYDSSKFVESCFIHPLKSLNIYSSQESIARFSNPSFAEVCCLISSAHPLDM